MCEEKRNQQFGWDSNHLTQNPKRETAVLRRMVDETGLNRHSGEKEEFEGGSGEGMFWGAGMEREKPRTK